MQDEPIIQTKELTKSYGPHVALDKLNISIPQGATGLLGQNGAGKSTFLKTVLGLIQATSGEGTVLGYDIRTQGIEIRQRIGYMPEYDALNPDMDAIHQVRYSGELLGMNPTVAMNRAHEALQFVGIGEQRYREIGSFSTGMKQATKLACAIIHDPDLLIADEPSWMTSSGFVKTSSFCTRAPWPLRGKLRISKPSTEKSKFTCGGVQPDLRNG